MQVALVFLLALLAVVVILNWRLLAAPFGVDGSACDWQRVHQRDRDGRRAWFCTHCKHEVLVLGSAPPPECGARLSGRKKSGRPDSDA